MRLDPTLCAAIATVAGASAAVEPRAAVVAILGSAFVLRTKLRSIAIGSALVFFAIGAVRAKNCVAGFEAQWMRARAVLTEPLRCSGSAKVLSSPVRSGDRMAFSAELHRADCEERALAEGTIARVYGGPHDLRRGDEVEFVAQLAPIQLFRNAELPDPRPGAARRAAVVSGMLLSAEIVGRRSGPGMLVDGARNFVRRRIDVTFSPDAAPLARALVLGETDLSAEDDQAFKKSGLAHLLAVSGTHLVLAVVTLVALIKAFLVRIEQIAARIDVERVAAAFGLPLSLIYADFAGGSGSAWRAAWMLCAGFLARALGRHPRPARTIAASLWVGVVIDPLIAFDISFLLSAGATAGLLLFGSKLRQPFERIGFAPLRWLLGSIATTLSAMLPCTPLLALMSPDLTLIGALANVVAAPIGELAALPACLLHAVSSIVPPVERGLGLVGSGALIWVRTVARASASATFLAVSIPPPGAWHFVVASVATSAVFARAERPRVAIAWGFCGVLALAAVEMGVRRAGHPSGVLRVSVLDIGQGDSLLVDLPDGKLMLIDGGGIPGNPVDPGRAVVGPLLRARRRTRVDIAVLSHPHPDHFTGLASALPTVEVGELWDSGQGEVEGAGPVYVSLLAALRARGVPIRRPAELCRSAHEFGAATLRVVGPCPGFVPGRDANDNSLVLQIRFGERAALLTGDAEAVEEAELVERYGAALRSDFLKVGHHGSRTSSSPALLSAVRPELAAISCGVRNRFGHPHSQTIESLGRRGIHTLRTDLVGGVFWITDGRSAWISASD